MRTFTILVMALALAGSAWAVAPDAAHHSTPKMTSNISVAVPGVPSVTGISHRNKPLYNNWLTLADCQTGLTGPSNVPVTKGGVKYIYCFGGSAGTQIQIYNIATNSWATSSVTMPSVADYAGSAVVGGKVYIFGGNNGSSNQNLVQIFNPVDSSWTSGTAMLTACSDQVVFVYQDSLVYVAGGIVTFWSTFTNAVQIYNVNRNTWASGTVLPVQMGAGGGGVVGNTAVFTCGYNGSCVGATYEGAINPANPTQITWTSGTVYPDGGIYRPTSGNLGNACFVGNGGDLYGVYYGTTNSYDPSSHTWTTWATKPTVMQNVGNYAVMDSILYVVGGYTGSYLTTNEALNMRQLSDDIGTTRVNSPVAQESPFTVVTPQVVYMNEGMAAETNITVGCLVDSSGTIIYRDSSVISSMAVNAVDTISYSNWTVGPVGATYTFKGWCRLTGDINPANDTMSLAVTSFRGFHKVGEIIGPPLPGGNANQGLAWDGANTMYWAQGDAASGACIVQKMDKATGNLITTFPVATGGYVAGAVYAHGELWIVQWSSANTIVKCDTLGNITGTFSTPGSYTRGLGYNAATDHLYITDTGGSDFGGTFFEIDTTGAVIRSSSTATPVDWGMAGLTQVRSDSQVVWVSDDGSNQDLREVNVGQDPSYLVATHDVRADFPLGVYTGGSFFDGQYLYVGQVVGNMIYIYDLGLVGVEAGGTTQPKSATYALGQAYPNPAREGANISFSVPRDGKAKLVVYNVLGQSVATLVNGAVKAGTQTVSWNGRTAKGQIAPSGVYFYRLQAGNFTATKKLVIAR